MKKNNAVNGNERAIVLAGEAGQGIQAIASILTKAFRLDGYHVFACHEFMSRIRGGSNSTLLRISSRPVRAWTERADLCIVFDEKAVVHVKKRLNQECIVLGDGVKGTTDLHVIDIPLAKLAADAGGRILVNTVSAGIFWGILGGRKESAEAVIKSFFAGKSPEIIDKNLTALKSGMEFGRELQRSGQIPLSLPPQTQNRQDLHLTGTEAVALGAIAGGCNFVSAYPMSPSTGVLTLLAKHGRDFGIIVDQAEDEISAANMVLGAWYAGARGITTTSGGGFALMTEAISLSGTTETPMVILLAQRPGPATGLPTRTEQGDLNLALHAGHGEFPRILLAPGNPEQAFTLAAKAFHLADTYQVPVIILTDQYLMDSSCDVEDLAVSSAPFESTIVKAMAGYQRYALTDTGISPRAIPGWGEGLVVADCHEHNEHGQINEDPDMRVQMVDKRLRKLAAITENTLPPEWIGPEDASHLVICWGSTFEIVREAVAGLATNDLAIMHFQQIFPLHEATRKQLQKVNNLILLEGNATGQLGGLMKQHWGIDCHKRILKYNGRQFSVEEVQAALWKIVGQEEQE